MRIAGITIPENKRLKIGLTVLYGIGYPYARQILKKAKVDQEKKPSEITPEEENRIKKVIEERKIEGDLKREVSANIKRLIIIKCYRGNRHSRGLPVRGQRSKTNARTRKGKRKK